MAGEIARLAAGKGSRTLFLVHRQGIGETGGGHTARAMPRNQHRRGMSRLAGDALGAATGRDGAERGAAGNAWASLTLVVIDEAHHARAKTWETVLARWPNAKRIGLTATPERLDGKGLGEHFAEMVMGPTIPELVAVGSLAPSRTLQDSIGIGARRIEEG